ncbi:MAG: hypothetical protein HY006_00535 [Candidatus Sungbacteria bacterium]|nr:hypothetical protein [Candidatus Sungbacteria bacterium]
MDAKSPYLLENQKLNGTIKVRAVDKAGNEAVVEVRPRPAGKKQMFPWQWIVFLAVLGGAAAYSAYKRICKKL